MANFSPRYKLPMEVGKIHVEKFRESIRLHFQLNGERYSLTIGKYSQDVLLAAIATAELIILCTATTCAFPPKAII